MEWARKGEVLPALNLAAVAQGGVTAEITPFSYMDDVNSAIPRSIKTTTWHRHLEEAGNTMKLKWDVGKDWEGRGEAHLGVYLGDARRHWKERLRKAKGAWECVRRLTKLPPKAKKTIVCGQLLPILCYGCEAFAEPNEEMRRLARTWSRWIVGAWSGSQAGCVEALSGVDCLDEIFWKRKIRWAASVYGRHLPALRQIAAKILEERYEGHNVQFEWMEEEVRMNDHQPFRIEEYNAEQTEEYSDGSRLGGAAAAGTSRQARYLGLCGTIMDAEMAGVLLALQHGYSRIALDSQAVIQRMNQLYTEPARSWIEI